MLSVFRHTAAAVAAMLTLAAPAAAQTAFHDLAAIDADIAAALGVAIGLPGGAAQPVDRRLRLIRCRAALVIEPGSDGASGTAVAVRCPTAGWRIRIPLVPNNGDSGAMTAADLSAPTRIAAPVVRRGDAVTLVVRGRGFTVRMGGVADQSGSIGDTIRVRTDGRSDSRAAGGGAAGGSAGRAAPVTGRITASGEVSLSPFN